MKISSRWLEGTPTDKREFFEGAIRNSKIVVTRLREIIEEDIASVLTQIAKPDFTKAAWAYEQAALVGDLSRLRKFRDLLEL